MIEIRELTEAEFEQSMQLSAFAFQYDVSISEREQRLRKMRRGGYYGAFLEGRLAAQLRLMPLEVWMYEQKLAMGGIASVASWPEYRKHGFVRQLLEKALVEMKDAGQTVSLLHPFSVSFYRKFGWELLVQRKRFEGEFTQLEIKPKQLQQQEKLVRLEQPDQQWELLNHIYQQWAPKYNGMLARTEVWWREEVLPKKKGVTIVYYDESGEPAGYVIFTVKRRHLEIKELCALSYSAEHALWHMLSNHESMATSFSYTGPADYVIPHVFFPEVKQEMAPYFMMRIVDALPFLEHYPYRELLGSGGLTMKVKDDFARWNDGIYQLTWSETSRKMIVTRKDWTKNQALTVDLSLNIETLAALLANYMRPHALAESGQLTGRKEKIELLEQLIPRKSIFLADFF